MNIHFWIESLLLINTNINYLSIETFLINSCFLTLLCTTLYYWISYIAGVSPLSSNDEIKKSNKNIGFYGLIIVTCCLFLQLCLRWSESGHFPLSNLYDSLLFLAWGLLVIFIFLEKLTKFDLLGVIVSPTILCIIAFTDFSLPNNLQKIKPLVPALQSNWLLMHVTVMIFSYAALILGCILSISYICYFYLLNNVFSSSSTLRLDSQNILYQNRLNILDNLSYRLIGIGFCFLTLGILSGAIWANETWGNYWSWDPKETWALITWLVFAIYLHTRLIINFQGIKSAYIAFFGFLILWICYLGVNLLGKGLHSYGFLTT